MEIETVGTVISIEKQWWFKINTKPFRTHMWDGAVFPHIVKAEYTVNGQPYTVKKWLWPSQPLPRMGQAVAIRYRDQRPSKGKIII